MILGNYNPLIAHHRSFWWRSFGFQEYWKKKMVPRTSPCPLQYNNRGESIKFVERSRLKLEQFYVPFGVLLAGYSLALILFIHELLIAYFDLMKLVESLVYCYM